jgi:Arc/MetJ-type ribon-helix-helix transcriptional regulator
MPEVILGALLTKGYFKTKAEVIRAGILALGEKYGFDASNPKELELNLVALKIKQMDEKMKKSKKKFETLAEVKKRYGFK